MARETYTIIILRTNILLPLLLHANNVFIQPVMLQRIHGGDEAV